MPIEIARPIDDLLPISVAIPNHDDDDAPGVDISTWGRFVVDDADARRLADAAPGLTCEAGDFVIADKAGALRRVALSVPQDRVDMRNALRQTASNIFAPDEDRGVRVRMTRDAYAPVTIDAIVAVRESLEAMDGPNADGWRQNFNRWTDWAIAHAAQFSLSDQANLTIIAMTRDPAKISPQTRVAMERAPNDAAYRDVLADIGAQRPDVANFIAPFARIDRPMSENIAAVREALPKIIDAFSQGGAWRSAVTRGPSSAVRQSNDALVRDLFAQVTHQAPESILASDLSRQDRNLVGEMFGQIKQVGDVDPDWREAALRNLQQTLDASGATRMGYRAEIDFATSNGMTFMKVVDPHAVAIYAWPQDALRPLADIEGRLVLPAEPIERTDEQIQRLRAVLSVVREQTAALENGGVQETPAAIVRLAEDRLAQIRAEREVDAGVSDDEDAEFEDEDEANLPLGSVAEDDDGPFALRPPAPGRQEG